MKKSVFLAFCAVIYTLSSGLSAQPPDLPWEPDSLCGSIMTTGIAAVTCGSIYALPEEERYTLGLIDLNGALPAVGRVNVTDQQAMYHHPAWHIDSIGNVFGLAIDDHGNLYAAASSNYSSYFWVYASIVRYGEIGGGANDLNAAGTVYRIDGTTAQPEPFVVLPQQAYAFQNISCENPTIVNRYTGPGLGNLTFHPETQLFYISNFEDGRIYRVDINGNILDSYDPLGYDNGQAGPPPPTELSYGLAVSPDGDRLFFGTFGNAFLNPPPPYPQLYSIALNSDGSFVGTIDNSVLPAGADWDNYVGTEVAHYTITPVSGFAIDWAAVSDLAFTPTGDLLVSIRVGCNHIHSSMNFGGFNLMLSENTNGLYNVLQGIFYISEVSLSDFSGYGGLAVFEDNSGELRFAFSGSNFLSGGVIHGIIVTPPYAFGALYDPISPAGVISYLPSTSIWDAKGLGGDIEVFKNCNNLCPTNISLTDFSVCSGESFALTYETSGGGDSLMVNWTDASGTPIDPTNLTLYHADCAPQEHLFYLTASCSTDNNLFFQDSLRVTVFPTDLSPFYTLVEEPCLIDLILEPDCADYLQLSGEIPDIQPGDTGIVHLQLTSTDSMNCAMEDLSLSYACPSLSCNINSNSPLCEGDTLFLYETVGETTSWSWSSSENALFNNPTIQNPYATQVSDGEIFTVIVSNGFGYTAQCSLSVEVLPLPLVQVYSNNVNCQSDTFQLSETGGQATSWFWTSNGTAIINDPAAQSPTATEVTDGEVFTVLIQDANGCSNRDSTTVQITEPLSPEALVVLRDSSCWNAPTGAFEVQWLAQPNPPYTLSIDGEHFQDSSLFQNLPEGHYAILLRDADGCLFSLEADIPVIEPIGLLPEDYIFPCQQGQLLLSPTLINPSQTQVVWSWPDGSQEDSWLVSQAGEFPLSISNSCETLSYNILVKEDFEEGEFPLYMPNAFSPNADGLNDCIKPEFSAQAEILSYTYRIFDRWGNFLFDTHDPQACWDGNYRGQPMDPAVFTWYLEASITFCGNTFHIFRKGDISLIR